MKIISNKEGNQIFTDSNKGRGRSPLVEELRKLLIEAENDSFIFVESEEWTLKTPPLQMVSPYFNSRRMRVLNGFRVRGRHSDKQGGWILWKQANN